MPSLSSELPRASFFLPLPYLFLLRRPQATDKPLSHRPSLPLHNSIVTQPSLFFAPAKDILGPMDMIMQPMKQLVPTLKIVNIQTSHWPQLEAPDLKTVGPARKLSGTAKL
jgi:pimeloyl-ACP methyl ester carboxylesterase